MGIKPRYIKSVPDPKKLYSVRMENLNGGLNIYDLDYRLSTSESPDMWNLRWRDGVLGCRKGQKAICPDFPAGTHGSVIAMCEHTFHGFLFLMTSTAALYCWSPRTPDGDYTSVTVTTPGDTPVEPIVIGVDPRLNGSFFEFNGDLYFRGGRGHHYIKIIFHAPSSGFDTDATASNFTAYELGATGTYGGVSEGFPVFTPTTFINCAPETAAGDAFQPENRLSPEKTLWYSTVSGVSDYLLPVKGDDVSVTKVTVDGTAWSQAESGDNTYTFDAAAGTVHFNTEPTHHTPTRVNTVHITYSLSNPDAYASVAEAKHVCVYGGDNSLCIVLGAPPSSPSAYLWSGTTEFGPDPSYFPMEQYNYAGAHGQAITGFGIQQGLLVIFGERSVGKAELSTVKTTSDRLAIELPFTQINDRFGCDYPRTIQLVEDNLVFCNSEHGVCVLLDSSAAKENNIEHISRKINGDSRRSGLLDALKIEYPSTVAPPSLHVMQRGEPFAFVYDDTYWVCSGVPGYAGTSDAELGVCFAWDFKLSSYSSPTWFRHDNLKMLAACLDGDDVYALMSYDGDLVVPEDSFTDFGGAIRKVYQVATQHFGSYDRYKDVTSILFALRADTSSAADATYLTDYGPQPERTPLVVASYRLAPRDLSFRVLSTVQFAAVMRRMPVLRSIRHLGVRLENAVPGRDLSVVSIEIIYNYQGRQM